MSINNSQDGLTYAKVTNGSKIHGLQQQKSISYFHYMSIVGVATALLYVTFILGPMLMGQPLVEHL